MSRSDGQRKGSRRSGRRLKEDIRRWLRQADLDQGLGRILEIPARRAINPLLSFFYSGDENLRWRAVTAVGTVTASLAEESMESARVIMRRLMWNLNDESGGIGWGSPEAMGDIMARHRGLAGEFYSILISYIDPEGNYLEHEGLQRGVMWGVGRLAHSQPDLMTAASNFLPPYLRSPDPTLRGLCAWAAGAVFCPAAQPLLRNLAADASPLAIWKTDRLVPYTVGILAQAALSVAPASG